MLFAQKAELLASHPLLHSSNASKNKGWANPKPGASDSIWVCPLNKWLAVDLLAVACVTLTCIPPVPLCHSRFSAWLLDFAKPCYVYQTLHLYLWLLTHPCDKSHCTVIWGPLGVLQNLLVFRVFFFFWLLQKWLLQSGMWWFFALRPFLVLKVRWSCPYKMSMKGFPLYQFSGRVSELLLAPLQMLRTQHHVIFYEERPFF